MLSVTRQLAAPFQLPEMLAQVTAAACRVLHAERGSVWLLDGDELVLEVSSDIARVRLPLGHGLVGACARDRLVINVPDCYADARFDASVDRRSGYRTRCSLTLPLLGLQGELVGVMQVLNKQGGIFGDTDVALAEALAAQCAVALSRSRMIEQLIASQKLHQQLELARSVQMSALPTALPELPGYQMHTVFQPADQTGGDTYDLALLDQGLLVMLGDATGHGIGPALSVTRMHALLQMAFRMGASLETAFRQVNDELCRLLLDGHFVTAFIGLLDAHEHRLRFLSGGQGPILHYRAAAGACTSYRATSFPMGAAPIQTLRPAVLIDMAPGDWLVLLSDGIYEYPNPEGQPLGRAAVEAVLAAHHQESPAELAARLLEAALQHAQGAAQDDDVTMVLLKRL